MCNHEQFILQIILTIEETFIVVQFEQSYVMICIVVVLQRVGSCRHRFLLYSASMQEIISFCNIVVKRFYSGVLDNDI